MINNKNLPLENYRREFTHFIITLCGLNVIAYKKLDGSPKCKYQIVILKFLKF